MKRIAAWLGCLLFVVPLAASAQNDVLGQIDGTVTYREKIALPQRATVTVKLVDASRVDAAAEAIAQTAFVANLQVPIPFRLSYSKVAIDPNHVYELRASIGYGGHPRFITTSAYPVITKGHPTHVDFVLAAAPSPPVASAAHPTLGSTSWRLKSFGTQSLADVPEDRLPYLTFDPAKQSLSGFSGCNRIVGSYTSDGSSLHLKPLGMTMMACPDTSLTEHTFTTAIESVTSYVIQGNTLELLHDGTVVATFSAYTPPAGH